jgi:hypothetical protein
MSNSLENRLAAARAALTVASNAAGPYLFPPPEFQNFSRKYEKMRANIAAGNKQGAGINGSNNAAANYKKRWNAWRNKKHSLGEAQRKAYYLVQNLERQIRQRNGVPEPMTYGRRFHGAN